MHLWTVQGQGGTKPTRENSDGDSHRTAMKTKKPGYISFWKVRKRAFLFSKIGLGEPKSTDHPGCVFPQIALHSKSWCPWGTWVRIPPSPQMKTPLISDPYGLDVNGVFLVDSSFKRLLRDFWFWHLSFISKNAQNGYEKIYNFPFWTPRFKYNAYIFSHNSEQGKGASSAFKHFFVSQFADFRRKSASVHFKIIGKFLTIIRNGKSVAFCIFRL